MISAITYGRNDDYGYGMHKRVAIGLNTLALQLGSGSGEIIFVDYNTPDHLPTLPELLWDTLTPEARRVLRVLRVRPASHARFASRTPLPVIEAVARNVALRRANPDNTWILSTNTDAVIISKHGVTLDTAVADLDYRHYGLPRFELPERCWESLQRDDAEGCVEAIRRWAAEARLREVVRGVTDVLYDNPGDFQLIPRNVLTSMYGFDEDMVLGRHVDHNICKRLEMRIGPVASLANGFELFHLGHARSVRLAGVKAETENDTGAFVASLANPEANDSKDDWGLPDDEIEEIRLDVAPGEVVRAVCARVMQPDDRVPETDYAPEGFDRLDYDAGRVSAHILDLLSTYGKGTVIAYAGVRPDTFRLVRDGLGLLGFRHKVLVPESVAAGLGAAADPKVQTCADAQFAQAADVLIAELGQAGAASDYSAADMVAHLVEQAVRVERARSVYSQAIRMFVLVNCINNRYEPRLTPLFNFAANPFTTRLRYGHVAAAGASAGVGAGERASLQDARARRLLARLMQGKPLTPSERFDVAVEAAALRQLVDAADTVSDAAAPLSLARARLEKALAHSPQLSGVAVDPPSAEIPVCGPARADAWSDPQWALCARRIGPHRNSWVWERAQFLYALETNNDLLAGSSRPLVITAQHEPFIELLASAAGGCDVLDVHSLAGADRASIDLPDVPDRARRVTLNEARGGKYRLVIAPHSSLFINGVSGLGELMARIRPMMESGGVLLFSGQMSMLGGSQLNWPSFAASGGSGFPAAAARHLSMEPLGAATWGVRREDLSLVEPPGDGAINDTLGQSVENDVLWPAVWGFRADGHAPEVAPSAVAASFFGKMLGEILPGMKLGAGSYRSNGVVVAGPDSGHVVFGPYIQLPPGEYSARVSLRANGPRPDAPYERRAVVEAALGDSIVAQEATVFAGGGVRSDDITLAFAAMAESGSCEIRVWNDGMSDLDIVSISLQRFD